MLRIGIIGSGFGLYGLLPAFNSLKDCKVVCICGKKSERLLSYCKDIHLDNIYSDWEEMLDIEELDVVVIAVPPNVQYHIIKASLKKGLHIFAEKPLAASYKQAKELFRLATKTKITHMVDFIFPEIKEWEKTKQLLDSNYYGKLQQISVNWDFLSYDIKYNVKSWKTDIKEGGGGLSFYFSHALYYLEYFCGEILDLKSLLSYSKESVNGGDVGVDLLLKFRNGVHGYGHIYCASKGLMRHKLIFQCEKGTIVLENRDSVTSGFVLKMYDQYGKEKIFRSKKRVDKNDERVSEVRKLASKFITACRKNTQVTPSFKEGMRCQKLIEIVRKNAI